MNILAIGATSTIAIAILRELALTHSQCTFLLAARDPARAELIGNDLVARGAAACEVVAFDAADRSTWTGLSDKLGQTSIGLCLTAIGDLPDQDAIADNSAAIANTIDVNATATVAMLGEVSAAMQKQGSGTILVISSVAGDRGRASNYIYGSTKSLVSSYTEGLRMRLSGSGVKVFLAKPGFVDTPMTASMEKGILWTTPEAIGTTLVKALDGPGRTLYLPWWWRCIMWVIRLLPEFILKRLPI